MAAVLLADEPTRRPLELHLACRAPVAAHLVLYARDVHVVERGRSAIGVDEPFGHEEERDALGAWLGLRLGLGLGVGAGVGLGCPWCPRLGLGLGLELGLGCPWCPRGRRAAGRGRSARCCRSGRDLRTR